MNDVVREPGWPVSAAGTETRCTLTARFACATTSKGVGSDTITAPRGIVTEDAPANVSARSLAGSIAAIPAERATCTESTVRSPSPKAFDSVTRSRRPPSDGWITWRRVCPPRPGAGGMLFGSVSCWAATQLATHRPSSAAPRTTETDGRTDGRTARPIATAWKICFTRSQPACPQRRESTRRRRQDRPPGPQRGDDAANARWPAMSELLALHPDAAVRAATPSPDVAPAGPPTPSATFTIVGATPAAGAASRRPPARAKDHFRRPSSSSSPIRAT